MNLENPHTASDYFRALTDHYAVIRRIRVQEARMAARVMRRAARRLQLALDISDIFSKNLTSLAILVGGAWALWNFTVFRSLAPGLQITVSSSQTKLDDTLNLVTVAVSLKNSGKTRVDPGKEGCRLSIRRFTAPIKPGDIFAWENGQKIVENLDMLRKYEAGTYWLEPGSEYHESETIALERRNVFMMKVSFSFPGDSDAITEFVVIRTD